MIKFPKINATPLMTFLADAWLSFTRNVQANVEHMRVTNAEATPLLDGEVLYFTAGNRQVLRSTDASSASADVACISCQPIAAGAKGVARTGGLAWVLFEPGLVAPAPAAGQGVYNSAVAGRASNLPPANFELRFGTIEDASTYATQGGCYVNINRCCTPVGRL